MKRWIKESLLFTGGTVAGFLISGGIIMNELLKEKFPNQSVFKNLKNKIRRVLYDIYGISYITWCLNYYRNRGKE